MNEIIVLDFSKEYLTFYGCKIIQIDGRLEKVEGVLIFQADLAKSKQSISSLENSYKILQDQANITQKSLKTHMISYDRQDLDKNSCKNLTKAIEKCKHFVSKHHSIVQGRFGNELFFGLLLMIALLLVVCASSFYSQFKN